MGAGLRCSVVVTEGNTEMAKAEQPKEIPIPDRALAELRNYAKRRKDRAEELRRQARQLITNLSQEENLGKGWIALALNIPNDWECDIEVGCFRPPRKKAARTPGKAVGGRKV